RRAMWRIGGRSWTARFHASRQVRLRSPKAPGRSGSPWGEPSGSRMTFHFPNAKGAPHPHPMNTAQQEVLDKVIELLSEHFDHAIVAVGCYDEDKQYSTTATYSGGVAPAIGL